jgi:hypothetical protein
MIFLVLGCVLVVGAAAASILARDSVPVPQSEASPVALAQSSSNQGSLDQGSVEGPILNREAKKDRLAVAALAMADPQRAFPLQGEPFRQAFASEGTVGSIAPDIEAPVAIPPQKSKLAAKPPVQKNYALLSDAQIAAIKGRLNLSAGQEAYWPAVEDALRRVAKKIHEQRQAKPNDSGPPIDPDSEEVQQLKSAAMPLLFQLREDQKREVRALARIIGLEAVASAI